MSTDLLERPSSADVVPVSGSGGGPARRAMVRWAWRLFRREWRQQFLMLALVVLAVAAIVVGAAVAVNTPPAANAGFGTAGAMATFQGPDAQLSSQIGQLQQSYGRVDVIANQTLTIPGSITTYDLRAQDPHGPFGQPMLAVVSGRYPAASNEVAVTAGVASDFKLSIGDDWPEGNSTPRRVVGIVENPQSLLDEFALVVPGQVVAPTQVVVLFNASHLTTNALSSNIQTVKSASAGNSINPDTIVIVLATLGMLLIGLVSVAGFTVLANRRLRSIGMLGSLGATDKNIRLVLRANGLIVGVVGSVLGALLGIGLWLVYRPHVEADSHHLIGMFALPWTLVAAAMVLAVVATCLASSRPARAVTRVSIVTALSGRPGPPKGVHRSAVPGVIVGVVAFFLLSWAGSNNHGGGGALPLLLGFIALAVAVILLAPLFIATMASVGKHAPIAVRLALRDLSRYRSRSGAALGAISIGVLIAVVVCVVASARYSNVLDYAGPNLASNQLVVYTPMNGPGNGLNAILKSSNGETTISAPNQNQTPPTVNSQALAAQAQDIATSLGAHSTVALESTNASLLHAAAGRNFSGPIYVATPQLLAAFGIRSSDYSPSADILTMRPGLATTSQMQLVYGNSFSGVGPQGGGPMTAFPCPASTCLANPDMQTVGALPSGTSAPNTVITEHAVKELNQQPSLTGWLIQAPHALSASQITDAQQMAATVGMTIETKSDAPTSAEIINWATVAGILLALGILAMTVGLIRSETAGDLRILTATGAGTRTRRNLTAVTAGSLGLLGAVLGTVGAYVAAAAFFRGDTLDGGLSSLTSVPIQNLLLVLVGMPLVAAIGGWLLAGRQPPTLTTQSMD